LPRLIISGLLFILQNTECVLFFSVALFIYLNIRVLIIQACELNLHPNNTTVQSA